MNARNGPAPPSRDQKSSIAEIMCTKVLCKQPGRYIGWPTIARRAGGELVVIFSGDRDAHVCPYGKGQIIRCRDRIAKGGAWRLDTSRWTEPVTINNTPLDDRDGGIIETRPGTLLVSWFTSLAFEQHMQPEWRRHVEKLGPETRRRWLGNWVRRSADGGRTWGEPIRTVATAPHGPIQLRDGRLLYLGNGELDGKAVIAAEESRDDGKTWKVIATVPVAGRRKGMRFCEPHLVETRSGSLVAMFRVEGVAAAHQFLYQSESPDGGRSWSEPRRTAIWGYPPHLIRLSNGWLLVSYGRRKPPYGERACISGDEGKTWDVGNEITLCPAANGDLGYPASVQLADGTILTVFYQIDRPGEKTCLMATHWRLTQTE